MKLLPVEEARRIAAAVGMRPEMGAINFYRLLMHSPQSARVENEINDRILWEGQLTERPEANRLRELAIMRLAWVTGSGYLWAHHFSPAVDRDLPGARPDDVLGVRDGLDHAEFGAAERSVIAAVDEYVEDAVISPESVATLRANLETDGELVELVYVIALWRAITTVMATLRVPLEGTYQPWPPDGQEPPPSTRISE